MDGTPYITDSQGNVTDDRFDPLYCANNANNSDTTKRCGGAYSHPDDYSWSMEIVTQISALGTDSSGNPTVATTKYQYTLTAVSASQMPMGCNPITGSGVPAQESNCVADNWSPGYNGTPTPNHDGDWVDYYHAEYRGFGVVYITSPANNLTVDHYDTVEGWWTPESNGTNYNGGLLSQEDIYQGNTATPGALLRETVNYYSGYGPYVNINSCDGRLNPVYNPCVAAPMETRTTFSEGYTSNVPWVDTKYTYDDLNASAGYVIGGYHNITQEVTSSSNAPTITKKWSYTPTNQNSGWQYYTVDKVSHSEIDDASGHVWQCQDTTYDEGAPSGVPTPDAGWATTNKAYSTCGNASTALTSYAAYDQYGNIVATVDPLAVANPGFYSTNGCTPLGVVDLAVSWTAGHGTSCATYDTTHTADLPVTQTNALGQVSSSAYDYTSGARPSSMVDLNGQTTSFSYAYDGSGNETINVSQPQESGSYTTRQSENSACTTSSTLPCYEIDSNASLYPNAISRTFYDSQGRQIETITPGPTPGDDTVIMSVYDALNNGVWKSEPFEIVDGSYGPGWIDPSSVNDINNHSPAGTSTFFDALGRVLVTQDLNYGSPQEPGIACSSTLSGTFTACTNYSVGQAVGDSAYYALTTSVDPNGHTIQSFTDGEGNVRYTQVNSGVYGGTLVVTKQTQTLYNALNKPTSVSVIDKQPQSGQSVMTLTTIATYDDLGHLLTMSDPDQGTFSYTYNPDGHVLATTQTSGSNARTIGINYDLLGRAGCEQTAAPTINATGACSAGNPLVQNTYDTTFLGTKDSTDFPIGHLTQSVATTSYPDGTSATVTRQEQFDQRGRSINAQVHLDLPSGWNVSAGLPTYQASMLYNDANQATTTSTLAGGVGYTFTNVYDATSGVLQGLANNSGNTANLATLSYNENAQVAGLTLLNGATSSPTSIASETFNYDANLRPINMSANWLPPSGNSGQILGQSRSFDNGGNVTSVNTTFAPVPGQSGSGGVETQNFCYDEQNRLIWAGNGGAQPGAGNGTCGSGTLASGLQGANYATAYSYTNVGQIWQGPIPGNYQPFQYLYYNSAPHQLSGIYLAGSTCSNRPDSNGMYIASYDPWGNLTSRAYNGVIGTLSYDALNHLTEYSASNGQEFYVYDASGNRVLKRSTSGGTTTLAVYPFGLEEYDYTGSGTLSSQLHYYNLAGHLIGSTDGTNTTYYLTDALGSVLTSFSQSAIQGEQVYGPYGNQRYTAGTMGTAKGYTGQIHDSVTSLDYYNARYYDPVAGQFISPDSVQGNAQGTDPYAYVGGNPATRTDPTGQRFIDSGDSSAPPPPPPPPPPTYQGDNWEYNPTMNPTVRRSTPTPAPTPTRGSCNGGGYPASSCSNQGGNSGADCTYPAKSCGNAVKSLTPKTLAKSARDLFSGIASFLSWITGGGIIGLVIAGLQRKFGPTAQAVSWGITYALSQLAQIAAYISSVFGKEVDQKTNLTLDEIASAQSDIDMYSLTTGARDLVPPALAAIGGAILTAIGGAMAMFGAPLAEYGIFIAVGGLTSAGVIALGTVLLENSANGLIGQQALLVAAGVTN